MEDGAIVAHILVEAEDLVLLRFHWRFLHWFNRRTLRDFWKEVGDDLRHVPVRVPGSALEHERQHLPCRRLYRGPRIECAHELGIHAEECHCRCPEGLHDLEVFL